MLRSTKMRITTLSEACNLIPDCATIATLGFAGIGQPEYLMQGLEQRFLTTGHPRDLTLVHAAGQSDTRGGGIDHLAHEGLLKRVIGGHFRLAPKICALARENRIEAYNLPQGVITHLYRDIAAGRPGVVTQAGLGTFVDPRQEGGKMNPRTTEDLVHVICFLDREWLLYKAFPVHIGMLRMTVADPCGNLAEPREACKLEALPLAQAVYNSGGLVIAQVQEVLHTSLPPHDVTVPGVYVDHVVVSPPEYHRQTPDYDFNPLFIQPRGCGSLNLPAPPLCDRKVIARRAAMELFKGAIVNLGIGIPEAVAAVAFEEGVFDKITLTVESGAIGGVPASGLSFGASTNPVALITHQDQFDFYNGGGVDIAFLGLAEFDAEGNVNVSRFGDVIAGCGGFIEISQNARAIVFCGTLTTSGLQTEVANGKLTILGEGRVHKAKQHVQQITFSGQEALRRNLAVKFLTERCVFDLCPEGMTLTEVAPGISIEKDIFSQMQFRPQVSEHVRQMPACLFAEDVMGLRLRTGKRKKKCLESVMFGV